MMPRRHTEGDIKRGKSKCIFRNSSTSDQKTWTLGQDQTQCRKDPTSARQRKQRSLGIAPMRNSLAGVKYTRWRNLDWIRKSLALTTDVK
ncbi:hypothetical protein GDO81_021557 [Engystomops pustulosus]|uniref:Uncharacterized protein n=1 Tax=Engystomops pustulosus TaxID=76066 RepID=A0AAV6YSG4_ENGPU|nr:hypothetical protein GDO81_021557 [Engystomops pustulosus]